MSSLKPCKRQVLIRKLRKFGFEGPYPGGKHSWMEKEHIRLIIPNPHKGDIGENLLKQILKEIGIDRTKWEEV